MATAASRRFSFWGKGGLALAAVLLLAAVAAGVLLARGDGDDEQRREAVRAYIARVNITQQALILELERISEAYRELELTVGAAERQLDELERAEADLRELRARLGRIQAPPDAAKLRSLLLGLVDLQVELAAEVTGLVRYLPLQAEESQRLVAATRRLNRELRGTAESADQQAAFRRYRASLDGIASRLEEASAPPVLVPEREGEVKRLRRLIATSRAVERALAGQDAAELDRQLRAFLRASTPPGTTKAERAAVIAFNERVEAINARRKAVAVERNRLDFALR